MGAEASRDRLWTRLFVLICFIGLIASIVMRILDATLAIYANDVGGSRSYGGLLTSFFALGSISASALVGLVIDRYARRKALVVSASAFAAATLGCVFFHAPVLILLIRFLQGASKVVVMISAAAMCADIVPANRMGEGMGYYALGSTISNAVGPILGLQLIHGGSFGLMFSSCSVLFAVIAFTGRFIKYEKNLTQRHAPGAETNRTAEDFQKRGLWRFFERGVLPVTAAQFCYSGGAVSIFVFLTLYARDVLGILNSGAFFTVTAGAMLITRLFMGRFFDRHDARLLLMPAFAFSAAGNILVAFFCIGHYGVFLLAGALYGLGAGIIYPALNALAVLDAPSSRRGVANSTLYFGLDLGVLLSSAFLGIVLEKLGYLEMFGAGVIFYTAGFIICMFYLGSNARAKRAHRLGTCRSCDD